MPPDDRDHRDDSQAPSASRERLLTDAGALATYLAECLAPPPLEGAAPVEGPVEGPVEAALRLAGRKPRHAAVLAPLYARDGQPHLIFTRRAADLSTHSGEISFPGGSRDSADSSLAHTALRETHEELGIPQRAITLLGALPATYTVVSNFLVTPYVGWLGEGLPDLRPQASEVAEVIEASLSALDDPAIYHQELWTRDGQTHAVHFFDLSPYRIWGLTGRILRDLLDLLDLLDLAPPRA